jgi:hypothetical protein
LVPTCSGGLFPLRVESSSGELGSLAILEASDSLAPGDVMAGGYLVQPGHSTSRKHIDVLLLVAMKNCDVSSSGWSLASSCTLGVSPLQPLVRRELVEWLLRPPVAKTTGRILQRLSCNISFLEGCLCKN